MLSNFCHILSHVVDFQMAPALLIFAISHVTSAVAITIAEPHAFGLIHPPEVICVFVHDNNKDGVDGDGEEDGVDDDDDGDGYDDDDDYSGKKHRPSYSSLPRVFKGAKLLIQLGSPTEMLLLLGGGGGLN